MKIPVLASVARNSPRRAFIPAQPLRIMISTSFGDIAVPHGRAAEQKSRRNISFGKKDNKRQRNAMSRTEQ